MDWRSRPVPGNSGRSARKLDRVQSGDQSLQSAHAFFGQESKHIVHVLHSRLLVALEKEERLCQEHLHRRHWLLPSRHLDRPVSEPYAPPIMLLPWPLFAGPYGIFTNH